MMLHIFSRSLQEVVAILSHLGRVCSRVQWTHSQEMKVERFLMTMLEYLGSIVLESRDPWPFWLDVHQYISFVSLNWVCYLQLKGNKCLWTGYEDLSSSRWGTEVKDAGSGSRKERKEEYGGIIKRAWYLEPEDGAKMTGNLRCSEWWYHGQKFVSQKEKP